MRRAYWVLLVLGLADFLADLENLMRGQSNVGVPGALAATCVALLVMDGRS